MLGRYNEPPGRLRSSITVDIDDQPLLRHELRLGGNEPGWDGPTGIGEARVLGSLLLAGPDLVPIPAHGPAATDATIGCFELDGPGRLIVALGNRVADVTQALEKALSPVLQPSRIRGG